MLDHASGRYVPILFRMVGIAREFATAPKDAFLVANLTYLQRSTHDQGVDAYLIKTSVAPASVAAALRQVFAAGPTVHVQDLGSVQQQLATSLTSLDLASLSSIDYFYTLIILLTGLVVFALAVLLERGRDFAMLEVLGWTPRQIRALLLCEIGYAVLVGSVLGLAVGLGFAQMLVQILRSIFDPPPDSVALPWPAFGVILALIVASALAAWSIATIRLGRSNLAAVLREA